MLWFLWLLGLLGVFVFAGFCFACLLSVWTMQKLPTTPIGEASRGLVEIKGEVSALSGTLVSPRSQVECVYFHFHVQEQRGSGKSKHWETVLELKEYATCLLEDETGACEVDMRDADLQLAVDKHETSGFLSTADPGLEALLQEHGLTSEGTVFNKTMRYNETVLEVGDQVYVIGDIEPRGTEFPLIMGSETWFLVTDSSEGAMKMWYLLYAFLCVLGMGFCALMMMAVS